jgi:hypothetical protein
MTTDLGIAILAILAYALTLLLLGLTVVFLRVCRLLDRYRLKYSFDKEIEFKEVGGKDEYNKEERIARRERLWRRRVFKD